MGARNFHHVGTDNIYAFGMSYEDENGDIAYPDEYDYHDAIENVKYALQEKVGVWDTNRRDEHELRSYPSRVLGVADRGHVMIMCTARAGYHEGGCFDLHILSDIEDVPYVEKQQYSDDLTSLKADIEQVYKEYSDMYHSVARFSNGEEMYEKVQKDMDEHDKSHCIR